LAVFHPLKRHLGPLGILTLLHIAVVERSLRGENGIPGAIIPYDLGDSYARFLMFISDSLHAGAWPIWYPYGHAGTPFLLNPQSQIWSPITWLLSIPGYTLLLVQWQVFMTILLGSFGTYFLANNLWNKRSAALLGAIAFNFTSARLLNAEHLDIIAAFSVFPWVFWTIERLGKDKAWAVPALGMFLGLLIVSGYPGVVLLSPLWFGAWAIWVLATDAADRASRKKLFFRLCLSGLVGLGISTGYWLPIATNLGAFSRGAPLTADASLAQSLSPSDLWHLLFATPTSLVPPGVTTDVSMRGLYFGILPLLLAVYAVVTCRHRLVTALAVGFVAALLMSMGKAFFVRVALHDYLPPLNMSRFPAGDSRAVAALAGSLLAAGGLANLLDKPDDRLRFSRFLMGGIAVLVLGLWWLGQVIFPGAPAGVFHEKFSSVVFVELLLVVLALFAMLHFSRPAALAACLLVLGGIDAGTGATRQAFMWSVPASPGLQHFRNNRVSTFDPAAALLPRTDSTVPVINGDIPANDGYVNKRFYLGSYSPFVLNRFSKLLARDFRHFLVTGQRVVGFIGQPPPTDALAFLQKQVPVTFGITRYLPDRVDYVVYATAPTTLVFNEMYFPGWKARIDHGKSQPMLEAAGGLRALEVGPGNHVIETRYSPTGFWIGLFVTFASWLFGFAWLVRTTVWLPRTQAAAANPQT
jgi:hypothetical protein